MCTTTATGKYCAQKWRELSVTALRKDALHFSKGILSFLLGLNLNLKGRKWIQDTS